MEGAVGAEFQDWEVLLHDLNLETALTAAEFSGEKSTHFGGIEGESDSDSIIKSDYFSLDNQGRRGRTVPERDLNEEEGSVESDNPSWIDPSSENRYGRVNSSELWSDSGSDRSDERKFNELDSKTESGIAGFFQGDEELSGRILKLESLKSHENKITGSDPNIEVALEEFDEVQSQSKDLNSFWSESGEDIVQNGSKVVKLEEGKEHLDENKNLQIEETKINAESGSEVGDKRKVVWWKVPFEVLKYCLFKASPVWSFSVAAALMGFIILGRKLYKIKRKSQSLHLKVILDEKKGSQFLSRAARLNEAFSVVRRVPIVRPALPAAGINPWPAMSLS
ncbi:uncharacterized protein E5676_scaffold169G00850 [Cucumis melo var. makuwa]|uniref:DUF6821 domain-containing protein n=1 Tax=Cucumis melo var. makuwa TaxID=1194695 RepID=A0A5D3BMQ1_CUCMM|nr:uncharacterized protein E6C27_scaffold64G00870 [Cucumis melo var. makuwa]TYK00477.1 uncharacterized protein E5676_scaffold169G00850 [Cucumis melo var. makuwa]